MNLWFFLFFGYFGMVCAIYVIPKHDNCVLMVLLCDDYTTPLTPIDNSTLEMFQTVGELNEVCKKLSKFRDCLINARKFCMAKSEVLKVGFDLLENRQLAFDLCVGDSFQAQQRLYMMVQECVNKYSHSAIEFCTDRAVETVGLDFYLGDFESECRFLGAMQHCHIAIVTSQCGMIASNMLKRLVVFRGERDFMCIGYENEILKNFKEHNATMNFYAQQYNKTLNHTKLEKDGVKKSETQSLVQDRTSSSFQSRISPILYEDFALGIEHINNLVKPSRFNEYHYTEKQPLCSRSSHQEMLDSTHVSENAVRNPRRFYEQRSTQKLSEENCACKMKASFLLMGILPNEEHYLLGYGEADVLWAVFSPLKNISCAWMVNPAEPMPLAKCSIWIDNPKVSRESCRPEMECELPFRATLAVYETVKFRKVKRVAELRVRSFSKPPSILEGNLEKVIKSFKNHAHDIRFWCSDYHEANPYEEPELIYSTSRIGFMPSDTQKHGMVNVKNKISDQQYNFYMPEQSQHPIDTEIHLISSGDGSLENEFDVRDQYASQDYENLNPFLEDEMFIGKKEEAFTHRPSKSASNSYRPYELYRPRVGETLEYEEQDKSNEDQEIKDVAESCSNPNALTFEDFDKNSYASHLHAEETCPKLPENSSKLSNKPGSYSNIYMSMADPLDAYKPKHYNAFPISKTKKYIPLNKMIWETEEVENYSDLKDQHKEIFVVTPSTKIETSCLADQVVDADVQNLYRNSQIWGNLDYSRDFEVPPE